MVTLTYKPSFWEQIYFESFKEFYTSKMLHGSVILFTCTQHHNYVYVMQSERYEPSVTLVTNP